MLDNEVIANIKSLGIDMIHEAKSGHPGIVLGAAPILYTLYKNHININTSDSTWVNRDRFVMSAGHGSALLYATLFMVGYGLTIDDLKAFRHAHSKTPGHPEVGVTPGVDCSTGPLGQGIANAVGMALGEKILKERYRITPTKSLVDYYVYALVGDGDLMEGISYEAASLAGTLKLNNLIVLYDSNGVSLDGTTDKTFGENVRSRFNAMGWNTFLVKDGEKLGDIDHAIQSAKKFPAPAFIEIKTKIGRGSLLEGSHEVHGKDLTDEDIAQLKGKLGIPMEPFYVNQEAVSKFRTHIANRVNQKYMDWSACYQEYVNTIGNGDRTVANYLFSNRFDYPVFDLPLEFRVHTKQALRDSNQYFIKVLSERIKTFVGGSADVGTTTKTYIPDLGDIGPSHYTGSNIWFGIREHAMGAILNGLALVNLKPYGSTFLSFSDYLKPAMRMSSLMRLPVTYIYTHDSIAIGPDGPTHQPIEQLAMLRAIPNMKVYRPSDAKELWGCWQAILNSNDNPSSLVLARNEVEILEETNREKTLKGGYVLYPETGPLKMILIATGTEVHVARNIAMEFSRSGEKGVRVVSMPCLETFLEQPKEYREEVIPSSIFRVIIEAGISSGWQALLPDVRCFIGLDSFGLSGTKDEVLDAMNFSYEKIKERIFELLRPQ